MEGTQGMNMKTEPVRIISLVVSTVLLALPHMPTFGVPITHDQTEALNQFLPSIIVIMGGEVIRGRVTPVGK